LNQLVRSFATAVIVVVASFGLILAASFLTFAFGRRALCLKLAQKVFSVFWRFIVPYASLRKLSTHLEACDLYRKVQPLHLASFCTDAGLAHPESNEV